MDAFWRRIEEDAYSKCSRLRKRGGKRTMVLNIQKVASDHGHDMENLSIVKHEHGRFACMNVDGEVRYVHRRRGTIM